MSTKTGMSREQIVLMAKQLRSARIRATEVIFRGGSRKGEGTGEFEVAMRCPDGTTNTLPNGSTVKVFAQRSTFGQDGRFYRTTLGYARDGKTKEVLVDPRTGRPQLRTDKDITGELTQENQGIIGMMLAIPKADLHDILFELSEMCKPEEKEAVAVTAPAMTMEALMARAQAFDKYNQAAAEGQGEDYDLSQPEAGEAEHSL